MEVQDNTSIRLEMPEMASSEALEFYHAFFDLFGFVGAREELERLMEAAFNEEYVSKHRCPAGLILFYEQMLQLVETAFNGLPVYQQVADEKKNNKVSLGKSKDPICCSKECGNKEKGNKEIVNRVLHRIEEPCSLSSKERQAPELVFIAFFEIQDLTEWKELLHQLMDAALSNHSIVVVADPGILPANWVHLQKLIDVSYFLYTRSKQQTLENKGVPKSAEEIGERAVENTEASTEKRRFVKRILLSASASAHPEEAVKGVFQAFGLDDLCELVDDWLMIAMRNNLSAYDTAAERADLMDFCREFRRLIEALFLINRQMQDGSQTDWINRLPQDLKEAAAKFDQPVLLTKQEQLQPELVLRAFYNQFTLDYIQTELWDLTESAIVYEEKGQETMLLPKSQLLVAQECLLSLALAGESLLKKQDSACSPNLT